MATMEKTTRGRQPELKYNVLLQLQPALPRPFLSSPSSVPGSAPVQNTVPAAASCTQPATPPPHSPAAGEGIRRELGGANPTADSPGRHSLIILRAVSDSVPLPTVRQTGRSKEIVAHVVVRVKVTTVAWACMGLGAPATGPGHRYVNLGS